MFNASLGPISHPLFLAVLLSMSQTLLDALFVDIYNILFVLHQGIMELETCFLLEWKTLLQHQVVSASMCRTFVVCDVDFLSF